MNVSVIFNAGVRNNSPVRRSLLPEREWNHSKPYPQAPAGCSDSLRKERK